MRDMSGLLKFITCGSVDDGKSTLIGHILYDAKLLYADQERALELDSKVGSRGGAIDYSLLLDGLIAEREQGITIDVAYRYFTTDRRSFIVADTPGHQEYTRNMAVGASFAQLAVILVDASQGVLEQTRRHARICALMGIRHFAFAVNKMDLVDFSERRFRELEAQIDGLARELALSAVKIIPLCATEGDNLTRPSGRMPWYAGGTLLSYLEEVDTDSGVEEEGFVLPIQRVCRPDHTFRGFQGQIESGSVSVGDALTILPSGERAAVRALLAGDKSVTEAFKGQPVTVQLDREADVSRGCVLVRDARPSVTSAFEATLLWMDDECLSRSRDFFVKTGTKLIPGKLERISYKIDINTGEHLPAESIDKNELALCEFSLAQPVVLDTFKRHRTLGEIILIDRVTNATSACGVIERLKDAKQAQVEVVNASVRACQKDQTPYVVLVPDLDRARRLEIELVLFHGRHTLWVDEPEPERLLYAAKLLQRAGLIAILVAGRADARLKRRLEQNLLPGTLLDLDAHPELEERLLAL